MSEQLTETMAERPLGSILRAWRTERRLSLSDAGRLLAVHPTTYQRWEEGQRPYTKNLPLIAEVAGLQLGVVTAAAGPAPRRAGRAAPEDASALTRARLAAGLNRVELGSRLHIGPASIYQWERGRRRPPDEFLLPLARELHLSHAELAALLDSHPPCRHHGAVLPSLGTVLRGRGCSRARARQLLQVGSSTIFEWETGKVRTPTWALQRLAAHCGSTVDELCRAGAAPRQPTRRSPLAEFRRAAHMTAREAAAVLDISQATLHRYEAGLRTMPLALCLRMAALYRVGPNRVVAGAGRPLAKPPTAPWTSQQLPAVLHFLRCRAGESLADVARTTGVSSATVRRWEDGRSVPGTSALAALELHHRLPAGRLVSLHPHAEVDPSASRDLAS